MLDDGGEVDLDLGNYERFLDIRLTKDNNLTTGKIYQYVINKERKGDYLGKTVQGRTGFAFKVYRILTSLLSFEYRNLLSMQFQPESIKILLLTCALC